MRQRVIALAVAMGLLLGAGGIAVLALSDHDPDVLDVATGGGDAAPSAAGEADAAMAPFGAGRVYRYVGPAPDLPDEARAYHLAGEVTEDQVAALAGALGVEGPVRSFGDGAEGTFAVTSGAALLTVPRTAAFPWSFDAGQEGCKVTVSDGGTAIECSASAAGVAGAAGPDAPVSSDSGTATPTATTCAPDGSCPEPQPHPVPVPCLPGMPPPPADLPTKDEAERIALDLFRRSGFDPDASRVAVHEGFLGWSVEATVLVDGRPVEGLAWTAFVGDGGRISSAAGYLSLPEQGDVYPLVTLDEAIERLNEGGFAPWGMPVPMATVFREGAVGDGLSAMATACAVPPSGGGPTEPAPHPECPPEAGCAATPPSPPADPGCPPDVACSRGSAIGSVGSAPPPCPPEADCVVPPPGGPEPGPGPDPHPEPVVVDLTAVRLGYVFGPSSEPGEMILIPAYVFETADEFGFPVAVAAVADRFLPSAPQPYPVPLEDGGPTGKPEPAAREPGG